MSVVVVFLCVERVAHQSRAARNKYSVAKDVHFHLLVSSLSFDFESSSDSSISATNCESNNEQQHRNPLSNGRKLDSLIEFNQMSYNQCSVCRGSGRGRVQLPTGKCQLPTESHNFGSAVLFRPVQYILLKSLMLNSDRMH